MRAWYSGCALASKAKESCSIRLARAICAINSVGRVSVLQTGSQWFEPTIAHHHGLGRLGIPYSAQLRLLGENEVRDDS